MHPDPARTWHTVKLVGATIGQTILLAAALGFLGAVLFDNPLYVHDSFAEAMFANPVETTWVVTLIATGVSLATTTFLTIAFKEAMRHRMRNPISLIHLSGGIALARGSYLISFRHLPMTLVTLAVFGIAKVASIEVSTWSALLAPAYVTWNVTAVGSELDITSSWFETMLRQELVQSGAALVRGNSTEILNLDGVLSGIAAAQYSPGKSGAFEFNGAMYNISTGGILPAPPGYNGTRYTVSEGDTGLAFAGGLVPVNLAQGLTANVTCRRADNNADNLNFGSSFYSVPVPLANGSAAYWLWAWNFTGDCSEGQSSQQQFVTWSNSSSIPQTSSSGFVASLVCPALQQTGPTWENFTVVTNASWKYEFLPMTLCTVTPLITTSLVSYTSGIIDTTILSSRPIGSSNTNLTQFLAALIYYQSRTTQGLTSNSIGDALYSIWISLSSSGFKGSDDILLREMEDYWRGVVEFSGTFLRSGFSAHPLEIPIEGQRPVIGVQRITTMGWYRRSAVWGYTVIPITVVAIFFYAAVGYTVWNVWFEERKTGTYFTKFDPSNPIHLMMASSAKHSGRDTDASHKDAGDKDTADSKVDLGDRLVGFGHGGIGLNEMVEVELDRRDADESDPQRYRYMFVPPGTSTQARRAATELSSA